jgi:hypothetical protein
MDSSQAARCSREVRIERWNGRAFFVVPCPFRVDLPLDMSGCIAGALRDTMASGHRRSPGGSILASDAKRGGAIFVEVEPKTDDDPRVAWIEGDVLARALPLRPAALRSEVEELLRWSGELGHEVSTFYVGFAPGHGPRSFLPARLFAALDGGAVVEHFEVRSTRRYVARVA